MLKRPAPAKINLGLHVLRRRADGFHDMETVFLRIGWSDMLSVEAEGTLMMTSSDPALPVDDRNLVLKAARLLQRAYNVREGAQFHLEKHVPLGAGLGGGSSDAATAILLLNELWKLGLSESELSKAALQVGSDVPFFLNRVTAIGRGRGEILEPILDPVTRLPYQPPFALVVAVPDVHVSTADAYQRIVPRSENRPDLEEIILSNDLARWSVELRNDFEDSVLPSNPEIAEVKTVLLECGAGYAAMSGTGSAVYGFFERDDLARRAAALLRRDLTHLTHAWPSKRTHDEQG